MKAAIYLSCMLLVVMCNHHHHHVSSSKLEWGITPLSPPSCDAEGAESQPFWCRHQCRESSIAQVRDQIQGFWNVKFTFASMLRICKRGEFPIVSAMYYILNRKLYVRRCTPPFEDVVPTSNATLITMKALAAEMPDNVFWLFRGGDTPGLDIALSTPVPVFTYVSSTSHYDLRWPTFEHVQRALAFGSLYTDVKTNNTHHSTAATAAAAVDDDDKKDWNQRQPLVFWRGQLTGTDMAALAREGSELQSNNRLRFMEWVRRYPEYFANETGFSDADDSQISEKVRKQVRARYRFVGHKRNTRQQQAFRYQMVLDGVSAPFRMTDSLSAGSAILKQDSPFDEHFYHLMRPWTHYIPVRHDLSDLGTQIRWALAHPDESHRIARAAKQLHDEQLRGEDFKCYIWYVLSAIRRHQRTPPPEKYDEIWLLKHMFRLVEETLMNSPPPRRGDMKRTRDDEEGGGGGDGGGDGDGDDNDDRDQRRRQRRRLQQKEDL